MMGSESSEGRREAGGGGNHHRNREKKGGGGIALRKSLTREKGTVLFLREIRTPKKQQKEGRQPRRGSLTIITFLRRRVLGGRGKLSSTYEKKVEKN